MSKHKTNTNVINIFEGEYEFLSNFYYANVEFEGITYPSNEHAFQAAKSLDQNIRKSFLTECPTPDKAKKKGRSLQLRSDWESVKNNVMTTIVRNKFNAHPDLKMKLLATGNAMLIEGTTWHDTYWGIDLNTGKGENHLGKILMQIRSEMKNASNGSTNANNDSNFNEQPVKLNYREINRNVMNDTQDLCEKETTLKSSIKNSIKKEYIVYQEDDVKPCTKNEDMKIIVSKERTYEAAEKYKGKKICCLDFANNVYIGGDPWTAGAQEESMCRTSTLYPCLYAKKKEFYEKHKTAYRKKKMDDMGNDDLIYVPDVVVFKTDESIPKLKREDSWFKTDVIVSAAPQLSFNFNETEYRKIMESRIKRILDVAAKETVEVLILGAFGCGAFRNPPEIVADIFASMIRNYSFEIVEFAVFCYRDTTNFDVFNEIILG